jgi:hypothetical protein
VIPLYRLPRNPPKRPLVINESSAIRGNLAGPSDVLRWWPRRGCCSPEKGVRRQDEEQQACGNQLATFRGGIHELASAPTEPSRVDFNPKSSLAAAETGRFASVGW